VQKGDTIDYAGDALRRELKDGRPTGRLEPLRVEGRFTVGAQVQEDGKQLWPLADARLGEELEPASAAANTFLVSQADADAFAAAQAEAAKQPPPSSPAAPAG
jgi:hypothetical protein